MSEEIIGINHNRIDEFEKASDLIWEKLRSKSNHEEPGERPAYLEGDKKRYWPYRELVPSQEGVLSGHAREVYNAFEQAREGETTASLAVEEFAKRYSIVRDWEIDPWYADFRIAKHIVGELKQALSHGSPERKELEKQNVLTCADMIFDSMDEAKKEAGIMPWGERKQINADAKKTANQKKGIKSKITSAFKR